MIPSGDDPTDHAKPLPFQSCGFSAGSFGIATVSAQIGAASQVPTTNPTKAPTEVKPSNPHGPSGSVAVRTAPAPGYQCGCGEWREFLGMLMLHVEVDWCGSKTWKQV